MNSLPAHRIPVFQQRLRQAHVVNANGCWIWQKSKTRNGYGKIGLGGGKTTASHRVAYMAFQGTIPDGLDVCHTCDVRACINPDHLFLGTRAENIQDAARKGRLSRQHQVKGELHPSAKLTEDAVRTIRNRLAAGETSAALAKEFGVSYGLIGHVKCRRNWSHVE